jgi:hypothetical protein
LIGELVQQALLLFFASLSAFGLDQRYLAASSIELIKIQSVNIYFLNSPFTTMVWIQH